jgi:hypothetical protein
LKTIDSEAAFELVYELFKAHPWLNEPGNMRPQDSPAEQEAVAFLAAGDLSNGWGSCSLSARRIASSLLLDFLAKLQIPGSPISNRSWTVDETLPQWRQALAVLAEEIGHSHPHLKLRH